MNRNFHLKPKDNRWELKAEKGGAIAVYNDKEEAVQASRRIAAGENGSVRVYRADDTMEEEWNHPADPPGSSA
jgi:hypothetical protein